MDRKLIERYFIFPEREKKIWTECIFIFDTSALLNFYNYSPETKSFIFQQIFSTLENRLWIPNQVEFEYLKNRQTVLKNPITEKYGKLEEEIILLKGLSQKFENQLINLKNKTKKKFAHPYLDQKVFKSFDNIFEKNKAELGRLLASLEKEVETRKKEILELEKIDNVLNAFEKHFQSGEPFTFDQLLSICKDGELRYKQKIPPGYEDGEGKKGKVGVQAFGDLIIWKQILEYARTSLKPIVLITDDVKSDWCYIEKSGSDTKITRPREELIKEMHDFAGVDFWMYTQSQFIHKVEEYYKIKSNQDILEDVEMNVTEANIKYDTFYISGSHGLFRCLKFFEDGEVIYVLLGDNIRNKRVQKAVEVWFKKGYRDKGEYKIFEKTIDIKVTGKFWTSLQGKIEDNKLILAGTVNDEDKPIKLQFSVLSS